MKKLMILCAACLTALCAMAQEIDAIKITQGATTDWYRFGESSRIDVAIIDGNPEFPNKTYNLANGNVETTFGTAPCIGEDFVDENSGLKFYITALGETNTVKVIGNSYTGTSYTIPASVTYKNVEFAVMGIGYVAFYDCDNLTSITIPATVTEIEEEAFHRCSYLTDVTFAEGSQLEKIQTKTFQNCSALTSIAIPASVTEIGYLAFFDCTVLETVTFADNSQLESIGEEAFKNCSALTSITIPASVTEIKESAFMNCDLITDVYVDWTAAEQLPTMKSGVFANIANHNGPASATLHVPVGTKAIYKAADQWKDFGTIDDLMESIREGVAGNWGTICMEKNITAIDGATFWTISGQDANSFILDEVTEPQAGYGYLIRFTAEELKVQYGSVTAAEPVLASYGNPIQGTYTQIDFDEQGKNVLVGNYVVYQNQLCPVEAWVGLFAHRAYVVANLVPDNAPAPAPGRARAYMPKPHQTTTGNYALPYEGKDGIGSGKFLRKGQLIIVKDKKMYNAQGQMLQ